MALSLAVAHHRITVGDEAQGLAGRALRLLGLNTDERGGGADSGQPLGGGGTLKIEVGWQPDRPRLPESAAFLGTQGRLAVYSLPDRLVVRSPFGTSDVRPGVGESALTLSGPQEAVRVDEVAAHLALDLFLLLRPRGFVPLHAAVLEADGVGVAFAGPSDAGKSTLAYGLARHGWRFLSDDSVLLHAAPSGPVEAIRFRDRFALDPEAGDLYPEIVPHARTLGDGADASRIKWSVDVDALYPSGQGTRCTPRLLVFPEITGESESRAEPVGRAEAFLRLTCQTGLRGLSREWTREQEAMVGRLVAQSRALRLFAGRDLLGHAERAERLILPFFPPSAQA